jgi:phosphoribosylformylglycinamidine synthase
VPIRTVGRFTGETVRLGRAEAPLAELVALWDGALAARLG